MINPSAYIMRVWDLKANHFGRLPSDGRNAYGVISIRAFTTNSV